MNDASPTRDFIGDIELELLKLVRHLDTFGRRCSLYVRVDRAGYLVMRTLDALGPASANGLARALGLDASTVTRQITALERQGYVARRANPADGRSCTIALTPEGAQIMHEVERERREQIRLLVSDWDEGGQAGLSSSLSRLNAALVDSASQPADDRRSA
jgi:DNA-binding MarR family transcriptional regulator